MVSFVMIETRKVSEANEQKLLRACLIGQDVFAEINDQIDDGFFFIREYKVIFQVLKEVFSDTTELIDSNIKPLIAHDIAAIKKFDDLFTVEVEEDEISNIIKILKSKVEIRQLFDIKKFLSDRLESADTGSTVFAQLNDMMTKFGNEQGDQMESITNILHRVIPDPKNPPVITNKLLGVPTGLEALDKITKGYEKKHINIIAARTSSGKTILAYQSALATAMMGGRVLIYTLEDSKNSVIDRLLSTAGDLSNYKVTYRKFTEERDKVKFVRTYEELEKLPIHIDENVNHSAFSIFNSIRRMQLKHGEISLVILDYIQCMSHDFEQITTITRQFQNYVKTLDIPLLLISQFNRGLEFNKSSWLTPPQKSNLRGSGALEEYAHKLICITINEDEEEAIDTPVKEAMIWVIKNKGGPKGKLKVNLHGEFFKFKEEAFTISQPDLESNLFEESN